VPERSDGVLLAATAALVAGLDQVTKAAVVAALGPAQPDSRLDLLGPWVAIEYAENRGAAFGMLSGLAPLLALMSLAILASLLVQYWRQPRTPLWQTLALGAIVGGAAGNLLDRVRLGYVVDFIAVGAWPNFNVADSAISVGVVLLLWGWLRSDAVAGLSGPA
jgi:signal peptidase II